MKPVSNCCLAEVRTFDRGAGESQWNECVKCGKVCNFAPSLEETLKAHESVMVIDHSVILPIEDETDIKRLRQLARDYKESSAHNFQELCKLRQVASNNSDCFDALVTDLSELLACERNAAAVIKAVKALKQSDKLFISPDSKMWGENHPVVPFSGFNSK